MTRSVGGSLVPLLVVVGWIACVLWVLHDARSRARRGHRVTATLWQWDIEEPETWALATLLLWAVFFPVYLAARAES